MNINAFETQKAFFKEISHYGYLFLETYILLKPNFIYLDCDIFILAINRTLWSWPLKKTDNVLCDWINVWHFFVLFFFIVF